MVLIWPTETTLVLSPVSGVAANGRIRSFRLHMLLVTSGILLGPAFSGILCLVRWPSLFIALGFACWLLRFVVVRLTSTVEYLTDTKTSTSHVARATSASKKLERRAQKKAAKQRRSLIFAFGSSFLRWFERMLCLWLLTIQLFLPLVFVLLTGKLLGTFVFVLKVTLHLLAPCLGVVISFVVAIPSTLSLVASILHSLCWICCLHIYLKFFQILHICDMLPHCLRPLLNVLCILPDMYCPMIAVVLSTTPTIVSAMGSYLFANSCA